MHSDLPTDAPEFSEDWTGDDRTKVADDRASSVRLAEYSSFLIGDIHHMDEFRRPVVLDLKVRKVVLDLRPCCTNLDCRFEDGLLRLSGNRNMRPPARSVDLTIDVRSGRFRDADGSWKPLAGIQTYATDRFLSWREVQGDFEPGTRDAVRAVALSALRLIWPPLAIGLIALAFYVAWTRGGLFLIHMR